MKKVWLLVAVMLLLSCNINKFEKYTVSATVIKTNTGNYDVATVILGKLSVTTPVYMDNVEENDSIYFPANVEPVEDAVVKIGDTGIPQTTAGVYSKPDLNLKYKESYFLNITINDTLDLVSEAVVPDSFSIISPSHGDTLSMQNVEICWRKSDSANFYIVHIDYVEDSMAVVEGYDDIVDDTFAVIPDSCFHDLDGNPVTGLYKVQVFAVNGAWKHGTLSFLLGGGNVENAWGTYAIVTAANNTPEIHIIE